ncbi:GtrA family protein [Paraburkholderia acidicola]|uniref:GtrA family protein n=1 Tax=Paraburkholderia acidicola TaxID=1912599 RepID=A0ABV1LQ49_9BURK
MNIALLYALFAVISTAANIGSQDIAVRAYTGFGSIPFSVVVGTGIGLIVKYVLDKQWIFQFKANNAKHDASTFVLYTIMGLVTTVIFWGFEFGFNHVFHTKEGRYVGAVIGLAIGYITKYHLDKKFVFPSSQRIGQE